MAKAVATKEQAKLPAAADGFDDYADFAGEDGFQNQTSDDISIPFFDILQGQSPELDQIEAAKPGMIINKGVGDVYSAKEGIPFVPAVTEHVYVEWVPKDKGGGLVAVYGLDDPIVVKARKAQRFGKITLPNGNELVETFYVYGIAVLDEGVAQAGAIAFTSTKIKPYQNWMNRARSLVKLIGGQRRPLPLYAHVYRLTTQKVEKNNYTWHNWVIGFDGKDADSCRLPPSDPLFQQAYAIMKSVQGGTARADVSQQTRDPSEEADAGEAPF